MNKEFKKSELKSGMVVQNNAGERFVVIEDMLINELGYSLLCSYRDNLTHISNDSDKDISIIYEKNVFNWYRGFKNGICCDLPGKILWVRDSDRVKCISKQEIAKKLGVDVDKLIIT